MTTQTKEQIKLPYERPKLYRKQAHAIFCDERFAIVEASLNQAKHKVVLYGY
jgi:hypothetical protein